MPLPKLTGPKKAPAAATPPGPHEAAQRPSPPRDEVLLQRMYAASRAILHGSPRERHVKTKEAVDTVIDSIDEMVRKGEASLIDAVMSRAEVDRIHPEILDAVVALTEECGLPSFAGFRDRVTGRLAKVDELIRPMVLRRSDGVQVSADVRKDARDLYRKRAKEFGEVLRREGSLDRFYKSKRGGARKKGDVGPG